MQVTVNVIRSEKKRQTFEVKWPGLHMRPFHRKKLTNESEALFTEFVSYSGS
jgi:hypothetical protein